MTARMSDVFNHAASNRPGVPEGWRWFRLECLDGKTLVTGAMCTVLFQRGPRKGRPNWSKRLRDTERTLVMDDGEIEAARAELEHKEKA